MEKKFIVFEKIWFCTILLVNFIILLFIVQFYCLTQVNKTFHVRAHTKDKKPIFLSGARVNGWLGCTFAKCIYFKIWLSFSQFNEISDHNQSKSEQKDFGGKWQIKFIVINSYFIRVYLNLLGKCWRKVFTKRLPAMTESHAIYFISQLLYAVANFDCWILKNMSQTQN